jgi:hypothetical protein
MKLAGKSQNFHTKNKNNIEIQENKEVSIFIH